MSDSSDSSDQDDEVTIPGRRMGEVSSIADTARGDELVRAEERSAVAGGARDSHEASDELITKPRLGRPPGSLGHEPTARGRALPAVDRTWDFVDGATLNADRAATLDADAAAFAGDSARRVTWWPQGSQGSQGDSAEDPSALNALLQDIERSFAGAAESSRPGPLIGHANRFQLTARLGRGGMGVVFKAFDHELRRFIAIKLLARSEAQLEEDKVAQFLRNEARAIAALSHPNIVQVFDISSWCDVPFLVMEYLEGRPIDELLGEPLPVPRVLSIAEQLLAGLEHAHEHGVIHRDLKPSNIFETTSGEIKILDFGIASLGGGLDAAMLTDRISGTPGYMSPEQWVRPDQDARSDVWAIGVLLVGMLTGIPLFAERNAAAVREEVLSDRPTLPERDYRIPRPLFRVIEKALEKHPEKRYQTVTQLRHALTEAAAALGQGARARGTMPPEQRQVTIVACSISIDSVTDFETAADILRTWHNTVGAIVHRGGGFVMSSVGASMLACFGYPAIHEDDAVRAVGVACAIRDIASEFLRPSERQAKVRLGVDTGFGVVEELPGIASGVPVLHGPAVQLAVHLRDRAEPAEVMVSEHTAELVRGYFTLADASEGGAADAAQVLRVGGRNLAVYAVRRARSMSSRFDAAVMRQISPLVGREPELGLQDQLWKQVKQGTGSVYCVVGDAGVGKSRLVHRLRQVVIGDAGAAFTCQCWPQATQSPFHPLISLLQQALDIESSPGLLAVPPVAVPSSAGPLAPGHGVEAQRARLVTGLARLGFDGARDLAVFASLLSLPPAADAVAPADSPEALRRATIGRLAELLQRLAARTPLLFVIEDLHWADHSTLDFLDYLLPRCAAQRIFLVLTARKDLEPFWRQRATCHEHELTGLAPELARALVRHLHQSLVPGGRLEPQLLEDIVARSNGLPLYIEELTRALVQRGDGDGERVGSALPATLLGLLGTRLDQLHVHARAVAQLGAVLGRDFRRELLLALLAEPVLADGPRVSRTGYEGAALDTALDELCDKGIALLVSSEHGPAYVFRHALLHDVAYQSLPPEQRRARHAQVAELLVRRNEADPASADDRRALAAPPELIAYHYDQADQAARALQYWELAGVAAAKKWAVKEAVGHFSRALQLLATLPDAAARAEDELRLLLALGPPLMSAQGYAAPRVEDTYARAYELCISQGRHAQTFPPLVGLWQYNMVGGNLPKSATLGTRLLTLADGVGDSTMKLIAMRAIGTTRFLQGDVEAALQYTRAGWQLYDRAKHGELAFKHGNDPGVGHGIYLAWALWQGGYPDQALAQAHTTVALARSLEHPMSIAFSLCYSAIICNLRGEHPAAEALLGEAMRVADDHQLGLWKALAQLQLGWAQAALGDPAGVAMMTRGIAAWRETGARAGTTFFYVALGQAQLQHDDRVGAAESLASARALVEQNGEHFYEPELLRTQAMMLAATAEPAEVASLLDAALALAEAHHSHSWQLRLCCDLVELENGQRGAGDGGGDGSDGAGREQAGGDGDGASAPGAASAAIAKLAACYRWFREGHDTRDLRRAAALLAGRPSC